MILAESSAHSFTHLMTEKISHRQAPLSMGFFRQRHWSGLPFPSPEDFPDPGIEPKSPALAGGFFSTEPLIPREMQSKL